MADALMESNFQMTEMANLQPLLWKSELISQSLTQGTANYVLPSRVVMILIAYIETGTGTGVTDRVLGPLSTVEYASMPNKVMQSQPTAFWFQRTITPSITLWQVPDGNGPYTLFMQVVTQVQDVVVPNGVTLDLPYRFLDAYVSGLAARLARIHAPEQWGAARQEADRTWEIASGNDVESVPFYLAPSIGYYTRG